MSRARSPRERPAAGSSNIMSFGSPARASATSSCRCSPWDSDPTRVPSLPAEADALGELARSAPHGPVALRKPHRPEMAPANPEHREIDVVLDAEAEEETRGLVGAREPCVRAFPCRLPSHVAAEELDRAGGRGKIARDEIEESRLAGPVGPQDRPSFAGEHVQIHAVARRARPRSAGRPPASGGPARRSRLPVLLQPQPFSSSRD